MGTTIDHASFDIGYLETLARRDSPVHRLDPRVKLLTTAVFVLAVVSRGKYEISGLLLFFLYPVVLASLAGLPPGYLLRKILIVMPFAFFVGLFNPLLDRAVLLHVGGIGISGGWVSFLSILVRSALTISAALILIATSGFQEICLALERLKIPRIFAVQLLFLYRYLFVLVEEGGRMGRARALRSFGKKGMEAKTAASLIGHLLLRTLARARRVHLAMLCRGFDGEIRILRQLHINSRDLLFFAGWSLFFILLRFNNLPRILGALITGHA